LGSEGWFCDSLYCDFFYFKVFLVAESCSIAEA
jgi:hypothetical protein